MRALRNAAISAAAIMMIPATTAIAQNVQPIEYTLDNGMKFLLMPRGRREERGFSR